MCFLKGSILEMPNAVLEEICHRLSVLLRSQVGITWLHKSRVPSPIYRDSDPSRSGSRSLYRKMQTA